MWLSLTLFIYSQVKIEALKEVNCNVNSSWEAERSAEAAMMDGLYSKSLISAIKIINIIKSVINWAESHK